MSTSDATDSSSKLRFQFSLRGLMLGVTVACVALVWWRLSPRPASLMVGHRVALIDAAKFEQLISLQRVHEIEGSPYSWAVLGQDLFAAVLDLRPNDMHVVSQRAGLIRYWPYHAYACSYIDNARTSPDHVSYGEHIGEIAGSLGVRYSFQRLQFRVECNARHHTMADIRDFVRGKPLPTDKHEIQGNLSYEGVFPKGCLVFFTKLDDGRYHTNLFYREAPVSLNGRQP